MEDFDFEPQEYFWESDQYWIDQREADDYRSEGEDLEYEDNAEGWEAAEDWERDD